MKIFPNEKIMHERESFFFTRVNFRHHFWPSEESIASVTHCDAQRHTASLRHAVSFWRLILFQQQNFSPGVDNSGIRATTSYQRSANLT